MTHPKVEIAWNLLAPYIASEDPPDLSNDDQAEILTAGALPQVWQILLDLEQQIEEYDAVIKELADLIDPNDPHELGGPHISIPWVLQRLEDAGQR